jgi:hypothetical protein
MSRPEIALARAGRCRHDQADQSGEGTIMSEQLGADMSRRGHEQPGVERSLHQLAIDKKHACMSREGQKQAEISRKNRWEQNGE